MATGEGAKISHNAEPSNQFAAIATITDGVNGYPPTLTWVASPGTLDSLFSDGTDLPGFQYYRGIFVSVAGTIKMNDHDGKTVVITAPQGVLPLRPRRIWSTGTSATGLLGLR